MHDVSTRQASVTFAGMLVTVTGMIYLLNFLAA
jgi:hypothetical protein